MRAAIRHQLDIVSWAFFAATVGYAIAHIEHLTLVAVFGR